MVTKSSIIDNIVYDGFTSVQVLEAVINWALSHQSLTDRQLQLVLVSAGDCIIASRKGVRDDLVLLAFFDKIQNLYEN